MALRFYTAWVESRSLREYNIAARAPLPADSLNSAPQKLPAMPLIQPARAAAYAACAAKVAGSTLTFMLRKGETMEGARRLRGGKTAF